MDTAEVVSVREAVTTLTRPVDTHRTVVEVEVEVAVDTAVDTVVSRVITKENKRYRHFFFFSSSSSSSSFSSNFVCSRW